MSASRTDFDRCFESAFLGDCQAEILHKWHDEPEEGDGSGVWHVCTIDSNDWYSEGWYHLDARTWTFTRLEFRPTLDPEDTFVPCG